MTYKNEKPRSIKTRNIVLFATCFMLALGAAVLYTPSGDSSVDTALGADATSLTDSIRAHGLEATPDLPDPFTTVVEVTSNGTLTNNATLTLNIPEGVKVIWRAELTGSNSTELVYISGGYGAFEITGSIVQKGSGSAICNGTTGTIVVDGGLLLGVDRGIDLVERGTVVNYGAIIATGGNGVGIFSYFPSSVTNNRGGHIEGTQYGIYLIMGSVVNYDTIRGINGTGVYIGAGGSVINHTGGDIVGSVTGVDVWGSVSNAGVIEGIQSYGVQAFGADSQIINHTGGAMIGAKFGVNIWDGGAVNNSGEIVAVALNGCGVNANEYSSIVNNPNGIIQGNQCGILADGGYIANSGTIYGAYGVQTFGDPQVINYASGVISGVLRGIQMERGGFVENYGLISGEDYIVSCGILVNDGEALVINYAPGLISGGDVGVQMERGGFVENNGTIEGRSMDSAGVRIYGGGDVINYTDGNIAGGRFGINLRNGGVVNNSGEIIAVAYSGRGINADEYSLIVNNPNGIIQANQYGVSLGNGGYIANGGTIIGNVNDGVFANHAASDVDNIASGTITGGVCGINLPSGGNVTNAGMIEGTSYGVQTLGIYSHVINGAPGIITGGLCGIRMESGGLIENSGLICGEDYTVSCGILIDGGTAAVVNYGVISGGDVGVQMERGGFVENNGTIEGRSMDSAGVRIYGGGDVINYTDGNIAGGRFGINLRNGGVVNNSGEIIAVAYSGRGVNADEYSLIVNNPGGIIQANQYGVSLGSGGYIANGGTIIGTEGYGIYSYAADIVLDSGTVIGGIQSLFVPDCTLTLPAAYRYWTNTTIYAPGGDGMIYTPGFTDGSYSVPFANSDTVRYVKVEKLIAVANLGGKTDTVIYRQNADTYDLTGLFSYFVNAGPRVYTMVGGDGEGTISGNILTMTKIGTITIEMYTEPSGIYAPGAPVTSTLIVLGAIEITKQPEDFTVYAGITPSGFAFELEYAVSPGIDTGDWIQYRFLLSTDGGLTWDYIPTWGGYIYEGKVGYWLGEVPLSYNGYMYRFHISTETGYEAYSDAATLTVLCPHDGGTYEVVTVAPTCVDDGLKDIYCSECDELLEADIVIPALGHVWVVVSSGPSGRVYVCEVCGETYTVQLDRADVSASVKKLTGNQNELTIAVTEYFADGTSVKTSYTMMIDNNAAATYSVGGYNVYVDTKGNDQIRACYVVR